MRVSRFFQFLAGSSETVIEDCPEAERNYHAAIGGFVLITAVAASLSGGYAMYTVFGSWFAAVLFGLFWGFAIGAIDRFIVMTLDLFGGRSPTRNVLAAGSRLLIAVFVAFVIARPLELRIFAPEIGEHLATGIRAALAEDAAAVRAGLEAQEAAYEGTRRLAAERERNTTLAAQHEACLTEQGRLRDAYHGECDGTAGTLRVGVGPICEIKQKDYEAFAAGCEAQGTELAASTATITALMDANDAAYAQMRAAAEERIAAMQQAAQTRIDGILEGTEGSLLTRLEALHELARSSDGMWWALVFITVLFVLVEAMPVALKLMVAGRGSYPLRLEADEVEATRRHRIERKYRERQRRKHRSAIYEISDAVRDNQRSRVLRTVSRGTDIVANDVNLELRRRTEVVSQDAAMPRAVFPPLEDPLHAEEEDDWPLPAPSSVVDEVTGETPAPEAPPQVGPRRIV
ncbi:MAG: DUF4407 domain-containing protein [Myxococcota bacterium]